MALSYKTRGNSSPQGKPKVYFACHPDDFHYFNEISDEILHEINCAVFYASDPVTDVEAHLRDLSEMNLIVIPVTARFLTDPSTARDTEFPFSQEKHIPVLPLVQEAGLVDLFNKVLGDIQFLDKNALDDTAISFEEKFKNFLTSILVGDELADKIRQAFDAYIFLSYRKKDRAYAQELMHLIHENEFCRDVAIWYDEFLTPGENFNDTIADALQKSKLFALAVTPNLVNETNYVMTTEYPMAKKAGKEILAAELVPTDRAALESHYADIPENIDAHDPKSLADALVNALDSIVLRQNDTDPRHNFFIGLAYLSGIDVEKNSERALSLITFAAESGLPEACEKLVTMYKTGEGVKRDYEKAIKWQEKLVEIYRDRFEALEDEDSALTYFGALWALGNDHHALGKLDEAQNTYQILFQETERMLQSHAWDYLMRYQSINHNKLGDIAKAKGELALAKMHYQKSLEHSQKNTKASPTHTSRHDLAISHVRLGDIAKTSGDLTEAMTQYQKGLEILEEIANERKTIDARRDLSVIHVKCGDVAAENNDFVLAKAHYQTSLEIIEAVFLEAKDLDTERNRSISHGRLGEIAKTSGDLVTAKMHFQKALEITLAIADRTGTLEARRDLSLSYYYLGDIAEELGDFITAEAHYQSYLKITEAIVEEAQTLQACDDLALAHYNFSLFCSSQNDIAIAFYHAVEAYTVWQSLYEKYPDHPFVKQRFELAESYLNSLT